eukprot:Skav204302  [mRNA]  locus=scaffold2227:142402:143828:- [translate_table: standard]
MDWFATIGVTRRDPERSAAQECHGDVNDKALFFVEDPAARSINRTVNVARGVKDSNRWKHLLQRCDVARRVLRMQNFNAENFFRMRGPVLRPGPSGPSKVPKSIQPKSMVRPPRQFRPKRGRPWNPKWCC